VENGDVEMKQMFKSIRSRRDEVEKLKCKRKWYRMNFVKRKEEIIMKTIVLMSR
jgi:hypothetical protein